MDVAELDRLQAMADAATAAPWHAGGCPDGGVDVRNDQLAPVACVDGRDAPGGSSADAEFIASSRDVVPELITEIRRLHRFVDAARAYAEESDDAIDALRSENATLLVERDSLRAAVDGVRELLAKWEEVQRWNGAVMQDGSIGLLRTPPDRVVFEEVLDAHLGATSRDHTARARGAQS